MKKDLDLLGLTWDEALDLTKDRSEWRDSTARCASTGRGRTKVRKNIQEVICDVICIYCVELSELLSEYIDVNYIQYV